MKFDFRRNTPVERYMLLSSFIVPRPIALVTTMSPDGKDNAAPFSLFNAFSEDPPLLILGLQARADGSIKDTTRNIRATGEFVVHVVDEAIGEAMSVCAINFPSGESEAEAAGLTLVASDTVAPKRIAEAPASFECRQKVILEFSAERQLAIGEVLCMHVREGLLDPGTLWVRIEAYHPIGRLFEMLYSRTSETFELIVSSYEEWLAKAGRKQAD